MGEPYSLSDDLVDWNNWLQPDEAFWANSTCTSVLATHDATASTRFGLNADLSDPQPIESQYDAVESNSMEHGAQHVEAPIAPTDFPNDFTLTKKLVYLRTTCASCDGPLDRSEEDLFDIEEASLRCVSEDSVDHPPLSCDAPDCGLRFMDLKALKKHSWRARHETFHCVVPTCREPLTNQPSSSLQHFKECHPNIKYQCAKCSEGFDNHEQLNNHCQDKQHAGYVCRYPHCGSDAMRLADLHRHQLIHRANIPRHPCPHCREYRGKNGFKRKDHLTQHIRNYHHIPVERTSYECHSMTHSDTKYWCWKSFPTLGAFTEHALSNHQSLPYVCKEKDCDRIGMNGFENDQLLKSHAKENHLPPYQCSFPGCDRVGMKGWKRARDMMKHMEKKHKQISIGANDL